VHVYAVRTWLGAVCDWMGSHPPIADNTESSFIARIGPAELRASSASCPWLVRARRGQRLNLTVHFAQLDDVDDSGDAKRRADVTSPLCGLLIDVVDGNRTTTLKPPCTGTNRHRDRLTYSSTSSQLKVYVRSPGVATYAAAAAAAAAAADVAGDDDVDDVDLASTSSPGFLLHYHGLL